MQGTVKSEHNDNISDSLNTGEYTYTLNIQNPKKYSRKKIGEFNKHNLNPQIKKRRLPPISARHFEHTRGLPIVKSSKIKKEPSPIENNDDDIFNVDIVTTNKPTEQGELGEEKNYSPYFVEGKKNEDEKKLNQVFSFEENDDFADTKVKDIKKTEDDDSFDYIELNTNHNINEDEIEEKDEDFTTEEKNIDEQILKELDSHTNHGSSDCPLQIDSDSDNESSDEDVNHIKDKVEKSIVPPQRTYVVTRSQGQRSYTVKDKIICIFPKDASDAITLFQSDIDRLVPDIHLNDSIIDFYLRYIRDFVLDDEQRKKFFFFNCFFFRSLTSKNAGYEKVKNWTRSVNIFDFDFVFIPINQSFHWKLAVICFPRDVNKNLTNPGVISSCILLFDSLSNHGGYVFRELRKYLTLEALRKGENLGEFSKDNMPGFSPNVPKQSNTSDCGLYLLHYAEKFCLDPPAFISSVQNIKKKFNNQWFPTESVADKRQVVLDVILQIASINEKKDNSTT